MKTLGNKPISIIYADDDEDDRYFFREALINAKVDAELTTVNDGNEFLKFIRSKFFKPDVIFLDINMPMINGIECLEEIRKDNSFDDTPVIMFSTSIMEIDKVLSKGANLFINKNSLCSDFSKMLTSLFSSNWKESLLSHHWEAHL